MVQALRLVNIVIDDLDIETTVSRSGQVLEQLEQLGTSDTVCAVNSQMTLRLCVFHGLLEGSGQFLVVSLLADLAVFILSSLRVDATDQVVKLRGGEDAVVCRLSFGGSQSIIEASDQARTGSTSIAGEDDSGRGVEVDLECLDEFVVDLNEVVVGFGIGELSGVLLPRSLEHLTLYSQSEQGKLTMERTGDGMYHRVDELDTVVLWRVVTGSDHDTNRLSIELARTQRGQESNTVDDRVEDVAGDGEFECEALGGTDTYAFIRNWGYGQHCVYSITTVRHCLTPAVPYWNLPTSSAGVLCLAEASLTASSWLIVEIESMFNC